MPAYETNILISAGAEPVWALLSEVATWHNWLPTVTSVKPLDGAPLKLDARYVIVQPKLQPATWTVTLVEPPRHIVWESRVPGMVTIGNHLIEEINPGTVKVTLSITFSGFLAGLIGLIYSSLTQSYIMQEANTLKLKMEGGNQRGI